MNLSYSIYYKKKRGRYGPVSVLVDDENVNLFSGEEGMNFLNITYYIARH